MVGFALAARPYIAGLCAGAARVICGARAGPALAELGRLRVVIQPVIRARAACDIQLACDSRRRRPPAPGSGLSLQLGSAI